MEAANSSEMLLPIHRSTVAHIVKAALFISTAARVYSIATYLEL
jgi:hypothetical protein